MRLWVIGLVVMAAAAGGCASSASQPSAAREMRVGVKAAARAYWQEAHFRFHRASQLEPDNVRVLNNLAVSLEALGRYEEALEVYKRALEKAPSNATLKRNHARFAEFYSSLARGVKPKELGDAKP
ncbi:MAG TPA: tetratricopeptide repeat protein [Thermoanaerobaculaceae bacterium]|nr:tetratricopeptide repeat protein [Thermoanaerobaculaceae bacterium]HRS15202.1 tetratricopeptide repeat protein [Thermoanaerobaculaceae bacterium]